MSRKPRQTSATGIYHVVLRGVNKQRVFEWKEDYIAMLQILSQVMNYDTMKQQVETPNFYLYAWCLMDNHIHLLIEPNGQGLGEVIKRITVAYVSHFNYHYQRVGHFFQDRFRSYVVEDRAYFFELLRYIHNNPVKAEICHTPDQYPYSSFCELTDKFAQRGQTPLCKFNTHNALDISQEEIRAFLLEMPHESAIEKIAQGGLSLMCKSLRLHIKQESPSDADEKIVATLLELTGAASITEFQRLDKKPMREALAIVREAGCSIRRLSRLTGVSFGIIRGAKNPNNPIGKPENCTMGSDPNVPKS